MTSSDQILPPSGLAHFPISYFAVARGVMGLALALHAAGLTWASAAITLLGAALLAGLFTALALKAKRFPAALKAEWNHPVRLAFFPATNISLLLLATVMQQGAPGLATLIWWIGALAQAVLTLVVVSAWISHRAFGAGQLSPAWFIPAVGNVVAPLAGAPLGFMELSWYFFAVGMMFWLVLLTLVFNRLIFHDPLPEKLRPTLVILIAPPAVAFSAWLGLNGGELDAVGRVLYNAGLFFTALVTLQLPALLRQPFGLPLWALSFPAAAMTSASFRFAALSGSALHLWLAYGLLLALIALIIRLSLQTIRAQRAGEICRPE
ncbi:MAG: SLAC1 anion channel family protein [Mangrovicoccus sp.]|nr:SLAC1 anion channel family protein [Mangrovicoccus sp.]